MSEARVITGLKMALEASDPDTQDRYIQAMTKRAKEIITRSAGENLSGPSASEMRQQAKMIRNRQQVDPTALRELVAAKLRIFNPDYFTKR